MLMARTSTVMRFLLVALTAIPALGDGISGRRADEGCGAGCFKPGALISTQEGRRASDSDNDGLRVTGRVPATFIDSLIVYPGM